MNLGEFSPNGLPGSFFLVENFPQEVAAQIIRSFCLLKILETEGSSAHIS